MIKYWTYSPTTNEITSELLSPDVWNIPNKALLELPLPAKKGYAVIVVLDDNKKPISTKYVPDFRGQYVYDLKDCNNRKIVDLLGNIKEGWTLDKPISQYDEWINNGWVTNQTKKYNAERKLVEQARRAAYSQQCDPLELEARRKERQDKSDEAQALYQKIDLADQKIHLDHPWPEAPEV